MDERWQRVLCFKLNMELKAFKEKMLSKEPEDIYKNAYKIDIIINLKEFLEDKCEVYETDLIFELIMIPGLLEFLYDEWLTYEDSRMDDVDSFLSYEMGKADCRKKIA